MFECKFGKLIFFKMWLGVITENPCIFVNVGLGKLKRNEAHVWLFTQIFTFKTHFDFVFTCSS